MSFYHEDDIRENQTLAMLMVVLPPLFFLPLVIPKLKESGFLKFVAGQTLVWCIAALGAIALLRLHFYITTLIGGAVMLFVIISYIIGIVHIMTGKDKVYPLLDNFVLFK